jgi:2-C-methyl-D-erythritol 4-phosphate cytidylyltransferase
MNCLAILVAAGRGERMAAGSPKAFIPVGGKPMVLRSVLAFEAASRVDAVVVVVPEDRIREARVMLQGAAKVRAVVGGGPRRQDSVLEGMKQAPDGFDGLVLVHDAARPLVEPALIDAVAEVVSRSGAAVPALEVVDTLKRVGDGRVIETVERSGLVAAQTPQGFRFGLLARAYAAAFRDGIVLTDEAAAVERLGEAVRIVPGSAMNRKLTTPGDLAWAEGVLRDLGGAA